MMSSAAKTTPPKTTVSLRMPADVHKRVQALTQVLNVDADSTTYRWIVEAFLAIVDDDKAEPTLPPILDLARNRWQTTKFKK